MRVAHLTDLHMRLHVPGTSAIARRQCRRVPSLLDAAVARLRADPPDVLICTGDLLDYPLDRFDDEEMLALGRQDLQHIAGALAALPCPRIVLPGNHDPVPELQEAFGVGGEWLVGGYRVLSFTDLEGAAHVPERRGAERDRFTRALAAPGAAPQIHVQHYVLWPRPEATDYPYCYADADALRDAIAASGAIRLVLSGHYHPGLGPSVYASTWYATAPSFCEEPFPIWWYELDGADLRLRALSVG